MIFTKNGFQNYRDELETTILVPVLIIGCIGDSLGYSNLERISLSVLVSIHMQIPFEFGVKRD